MWHSGREEREADWRALPSDSYQRTDKTISSIKRHMGSASYRCSIESGKVHLREISTMIHCGEAKADARELSWEKTVTGRRLSRFPAYFNDAQRQATRMRGKITRPGCKAYAISEPTAAALAYGLDNEKEQKDHGIRLRGGGTLMFPLSRIGDGVIEGLYTNWRYPSGRR